LTKSGTASVSRTERHSKYFFTALSVSFHNGQVRSLRPLP
jgi:hypothetical protein